MSLSIRYQKSNYNGNGVTSNALLLTLNSSDNNFKFFKKLYYKVALPNNMYFSKKCLKF